MEVKLDVNTLPKDGQKIKWQTHSEAGTDKWNEGTRQQTGRNETLPRKRHQWQVQI